MFRQIVPAVEPVANIVPGNSTKSIPTTRSRDSAESALKTNVDQVLWSCTGFLPSTVSLHDLCYFQFCMYLHSCPNILCVIMHLRLSCQPRYGHVTTNLSSDHITFDHQWCRVAVHLCKILPPTISGVFMAMHFNRYYCGKCSLTYLIKKEAHERQRENSFAKSNVIRKSCTWQVCGTEHG